jgi:putative phosphoesterase
MRVLLLSDTHGVLDPRVAELAQDCELAVHAGDVGASGVLDALAAAAGRVLAVRGNNDVPPKWRGSLDDLAALPEVLDIPLPGGRLVVVHGHRQAAPQRHARLRATYAEARAVLYGHSHRQVQDLEAPVWVLNPGAAGRARTIGGAGCLVLETTETDWRIGAHRFPMPPLTRSSYRYRRAD